MHGAAKNGVGPRRFLNLHVAVLAKNGGRPPRKETYMNVKRGRKASTEDTKNLQKT
ncbi:hypothetical protein P186_0898 [Pyrobaculum ferrireducens]|uniref:Uncharacterized protein n=1 Tax=Pyrobaculum ferrireducens TaxID=1104324 RepID=G7VB29_9CREN|nr:hypothetical protein P186_0898 [Pyrobaculum ferrireducens]